jgi:hypothetical protein
MLWLTLFWLATAAGLMVLSAIGSTLIVYLVSLA